MKKRFTLLGGLLIGIVATLCTFSVSATVTTAEDDVSYSINCEKIISNVSRETFVSFDGEMDFRVYSYFLHSDQEQRASGLKFNKDIEIRDESFVLKIAPYNNPYFVRSQRWIKWNNIKAIGESENAKNVSTIDVLISDKLLC